MNKFQSGLYMALNKKEFWKGTVLENKEKLVDTSGFVPLDVRFKKLDIATAQRKLALSQFDYRDFDELYDDEIIFSKYDSLEELNDKLEKYTSRKKDLIARKYAEYVAARQNVADAGATNQQAQKPAEKPVENNKTNE